MQKILISVTLLALVFCASS